MSSTSFSLAILLATERLKVIAAVHPGLWHPGVLAKLGATADDLSNGRFAVNVVSGWFKGEFTALGEPWLEHDERYRRSEEFIRALRGAWTVDNFNMQGDFYRFHDFDLRPKPLQKPHPEIFQGGNSTAARRMAGRVSDWYFMNGNTPENFRAQIDEVSAVAAVNARTIRFAANAFMIARPTEHEAHDVLREIIDKADVEAVHGFGEAVKQAGKSAHDGKGMWQNSNFDDLVQYNDGFRSGLIGTPDQIAQRIMQIKAQGVGLILLGFLHFIEEVEQFGREICRASARSRRVHARKWPLRSSIDVPGRIDIVSAALKLEEVGSRQAPPNIAAPARPAHVITSGDEAIRVASDLAAEFAPGAAERDRDRLLPLREIERFSQSGLWGITVPREYGGAFVSNVVLAEVIKLISEADPSIGQIPQNHLYMVEGIRLDGTERQKKFFFDLVLRGYRFGNAFSEIGTKSVLDVQTAVRKSGFGYVLNGKKFYSSGALLAHWIPVVAKDETDQTVVVFVERGTPGLTLIDDWSSFGQRSTASGTTILENISVPDWHILPHHLAFDRPTPMGPVAQIIQAAVDVGIARAAVKDTIAFVRKQSRPWIDSPMEHGYEDPLTLFQVGELELKLTRPRRSCNAQAKSSTAPRPIPPRRPSPPHRLRSQRPRRSALTPH